MNSTTEPAGAGVGVGFGVGFGVGTGVGAGIGAGVGTTTGASTGGSGTGVAAPVGTGVAAPVGIGAEAPVGAGTVASVGVGAAAPAGTGAEASVGVGVAPTVGAVVIAADLEAGVETAVGLMTANVVWASADLASTGIAVMPERAPPRIGGTSINSAERLCGPTVDDGTINVRLIRPPELA